MKDFFDKNKVLILGLAGALLLALQQFAMEPQVDWKVIGLAVAIAGISYIAKNWRGQSASIIGILGNVAYAFTTVWETGHFNLSQFIIQLILTFGFAALPDPKSRGYEQTDTIRSAKVEGERNIPSAMTSVQIKKEAGV